MEKLPLVYNGSKVTYQRNKNGERSIVLPVSADWSGNYVRNLVERD